MQTSFLYHMMGVANHECTHIDNKIKTIKRQAYGFRDDEYFKLRILSMHDDIYAKL